MEKQPFYSIPFRTGQLGKSGSLEKCSLSDSIRQHIRLLLLTPPGRFRYDPFYGCKIHWYQFLVSNRAMEGRKEEDQFRLDIQENIRSLIERFEPRIELTDVTIALKQDPSSHIPWKTHGAGKPVIQVVVWVKGKIKPEFAFDQQLELEDTISLV